jgi:signal transduction histidine kinase
MAEICVGAYPEAVAEARYAIAERMQEFADALTHELNTPLGAAEGAALLLENDDMVGSAQERRRFAALIQRNLIANAAKYSDVRQHTRFIRIRFGQEAGAYGGWWLEVGDNGLGIPRESQERVFERFFRAHPDRAEGTGLGLAIVRAAAQQLGGRVTLESEPGVGTTFRVSFPAAGAEGRG